MNARFDAVRRIAKRKSSISEASQIKHSVQFASRVFHRGLIENLPKEIAKNWLASIDGRTKLDPAHASVIAEALKSWAIQHGATHFTHWFQPLASSIGEKQVSFLSWASNGTVLEKFGAQELLRAEPEPSFFLTEGLGCAYAARGYAVWDPTFFPFLWEGGSGLTLCIGAVFLSFKGEALDHKIPLMRSEEKLNQAALKLCKLTGTEANRVFSTLAVEQEYFLIDRSLYLLRPDLLLAGRTVFGAKPPKGQELKDQHFASAKDRAAAFMQDFERMALQIGIPVKTRYSEVAPAQYEVASLFEKASCAIDHNLLLMELMKNCAVKHDLACLFHEKPFMGFNGSAKHNSWSMETDTGFNLLEPQKNGLLFLTLLTAILRAVDEHEALLKASIASAGNDHRLASLEELPINLSVYLGEPLEKIIGQIIHGQKLQTSFESIDLGAMALDGHENDFFDRARTSFFVFSGNKLGFRAVGASAHCAVSMTVINAIVADSLELILDEISSVVGDRKVSRDELFGKALPVLQKHLKASQKAALSGNSCSMGMGKEVLERELPNTRKTHHCISEFLEKKSLAVFEGVLTEEELRIRTEILIEQYCKIMHIDVALMIELFQTQILPAAQKDMKERKIDEPLIAKAISVNEELKKLLSQMVDMGWEAKGKVYAELVGPKMEELRLAVDQLEMVVDNSLWPLPKYRELLFLI